MWTTGPWAMENTACMPTGILLTGDAFCNRYDSVWLVTRLVALLDRGPTTMAS